jgi:hypothetical protein
MPPWEVDAESGPAVTDKLPILLDPGLMRGEAKHIANTLQRYPVKILKQWTQDGIWHTIYGEVVRKG